MRLVRFDDEGRARWGIRRDDAILDLDASTFADALARASAPASGRVVAASEARLLAPLEPTAKVICVGLNYADHIREMNRPWPEKPVIFTRFADSLVGPADPLVAPAASERFDYEGELAVVIGAPGRRISRDDALQHVAGFTILNDGSVRDYQRHTHQFAPGKNFPASGSIGPEIVSADEFGPVGTQRIVTRVDGATVQSSTLDQLVFDVADLIAYCSEWTALAPGDVIATGTPGGVGDGREPALWLRAGGTVEVKIDGLGVLSNDITAELA